MQYPCLTYISDFILSAQSGINNTCMFNQTGHPALSINAGFSEGLPVGMMIVGRHWEDGMVLRVAHAWEKIRETQDKELSV